MQRLKNWIARLLTADPIAVEAGLATTTFWLMFIFLAPLDTSSYYRFQGIPDGVFIGLLAVLLFLQSLGMIMQEAKKLRTVSATLAALVYFFMGYASISLFYGGFGNVMFVPAIGALYVILRLGDK
jgi:peptidoglycan/LPS O-acetylase OafA/YrhL